jgi:acetylornithine deacetylase/succinyl-diaminopimelate desuccinylase-like protein
MGSVLKALERRFDVTVGELVEFAQIPSVSADGFDPREVERSAGHAACLLADAGFNNVEVLRLSDAHPYVVGDWLHGGVQAPTVLIYAHHDVQPPGRLDRWETPAFEPTLRDDGRLYGRGVVDNKAGLLVYLAAARAWLEATGALPINVKVVVDGEEEIGSPHLAEFLTRYQERLACGVIVLSDTANLQTGLPSLTTSLRGLVAVDVTVRALHHPIHSGLWGGPILDAGTALACLLSRLVDDRGVIAIPGFYEEAPDVGGEERARLAALPFDEAAFRADAGLLPSSHLAGEAERSVYERLWLRPSLSITALEAVPLASASNQLMSEARARVSVRVAPGQNPRRLRDQLVSVLHHDPPWGVEVTTRGETALPGWRISSRGPVFDAARRALAEGFGREPVEIGCGGTIPFVGPFSGVMGDVPALLLGLEDPVCNAHGENESLALEDFHKACRASACLFAELSELCGSPLDRQLHRA